MSDLDHMLTVIRDAFVSAPAWTEAQPRMTYKRKNVGYRLFENIPDKPKSALPPGPFVLNFTLPDNPASEEAKVRYLRPAGHALALHARQQGERGPEAVELSIKAGPAFEGKPTIQVTGEPVKR